MTCPTKESSPVLTANEKEAMTKANATQIMKNKVNNIEPTIVSHTMTMTYRNMSENFRDLAIGFSTEHSFTDCTALYRIPLELLKNMKQHNEILFFRTCF